jgi:NitT/TauT family transport system permease protein
MSHPVEQSTLQPVESERPHDLRSERRLIPPLAVWPSWVLFCVSLGLLVVLWQGAIVAFSIPEYTLPSPWAVAGGIRDNWELLLENSRVTLVEILVGFGLAVALGFPTAAALAFSRVLDRLLYPILVAGQNVPKVAIAPIMVLWFGFGFKSNVAIAASIAIFPIIINTALGLKSIETDMVRLGRVMGGSPMRLMWKIRLPNAMPFVFAGLKLGMTFAVIGAIVGEFISGSSGLGYLIQVATGQLRTVLAFSSIVVLSAMGIALYYAVEAIERVSIRWHSSQNEHRR